MVREMRRKPLDRPRAKARLGVCATSRRRDIVGFVDNKDVKLARIGDLGRQGVLQEAEALALLDPIHRGDQIRECRPWVCLNAALAAEVLDELAIDDLELEPELLVHFPLPVREIGCGRDDENGTGAVTDQKLLNDKARLNRLAETRIVRDEQVHAGHVDGADKRIKLIVLDCNAAAKRREQVVAVHVRGDAPADGVQERLKLFVVVVAVDFRQPGLLKNACPRFYLPYYGNLFAACILFDGFKRNKILTAIIVAFGTIRINVGYQPLTAANLDKLAGLGNAHGIGSYLGTIGHPCSPSASPVVSNGR